MQYRQALYLLAGRSRAGPEGCRLSQKRDGAPAFLLMGLHRAFGARFYRGV
jgi:hypothetical protein